MVLSERVDAEAEALEGAARAWEERNRRAFVDGYLAVPSSMNCCPGPAPIATRCCWPSSWTRLSMSWTTSAPTDRSASPYRTAVHRILLSAS